MHRLTLTPDQANAISALADEHAASNATPVHVQTSNVLDTDTGRHCVGVIIERDEGYAYLVNPRGETVELP